MTAQSNRMRGMCVMAYVASNEPLPTLPWNEQAPAFYVTALFGPEEAVRKQFTLPHVYYVGSGLGCGCHFIFESDQKKDLEQMAEATRDRSDLVKFLSAALANQQSVQLFTCQDGDQSNTPTKSRVVSPEFFESTEAFPSDDEVFSYVVQSPT